MALRIVQSTGASLKQGDSKPLKVRSEDLRRILFAVHRALRGLPNPRRQKAAYAAALGFVASIATERAIAGLFGGRPHVFPAVVVGLLLACGAFFLVARFSRASRSHVEEVDRLLADYEPVSIDAYRRLQDSARTFGALSYEQVLDWHSEELEALKSAQGHRPRKRDDAVGGLRFLRRRI